VIPDTSSSWLPARVGVLTGSVFGKAIAKTKDGKWAASRKDLLFEKLAERLTGVAADHFVTPAMQWGLDHEAGAKGLIEASQGIFVDKAGFCLHPTIEFFGATPDGFIDTDGVLEIKCPTTKTHLTYLCNKKVPSEYVPQMLAELACAGRRWALFASYDPRMPPAQQLFLTRFEPTADAIAECEEQAKEFLKELETMFRQITEA
jgi:hypothetical protein